MLRPIFLHLQSGEGMDNRFDTLMMVNGSIAALCTIAQALGCHPLAIDEAYPGPEFLRTRVRQEIEESLHKGDTPVIFCTVLSYNAESSLRLLKELKAEYGDQVRTGVGGQLIRVAPKAYLTKRYLDHVAVGDAEVTLAPVLIGGQRFAEGYLFGGCGGSQGLIQLAPQRPRSEHYAPLSYDSYTGIQERLTEMANYRLGPFSGIRQLVVESVRGCAWAHTFGICDMCSLEGVALEPHFKPLVDHFQVERQMVEEYGVNWLFDVSNQWLPKFGEDGRRWLQQYVATRKQFQLPDVHKYVYLTSNSITKSTAPLLREAGVRVAYVGIDGWEDGTWKALGKSHNVVPALEAARQNDLYLRASVVIGNGITKANLAELPRFVEWLTTEYGSTLLSFGCFMEIILQGSPVWYKFEALARERGIQEAVTLYDKMATEGWLSWEDEVNLTRLYINHTQRASYEEALAARNQAKAKVDASGSTVGTTIEDGGELKALVSR